MMSTVKDEINYDTVFHDFSAHLVDDSWGFAAKRSR